MPIAPRLGWLFLLTAVSAQEPALAPSPGAAPAALQASVVSVAAADMRFASNVPAAERSPDGANESSTPPVPHDPSFAVPEAQTLLVVGAVLVMLAFAKRRARVPAVPLAR